MNTSPFTRPRIWLAGAALAVALPVLAQGATPDKASIDASYQRDRAACASAQDRNNCLRDVGAARAQALRGGARTSPSSEELARNAVQRCKAHPPAQQAICERMAQGEGSVSGSVSGGGTIREIVTQEPAPPMMRPDMPPMMPPMAPAPAPAR